MTQTILCTVDFSEDSKETLRWAAAMAKSLEARLTILHTYRLLNKSSAGEALQMKKKLVDEANRKFGVLEREVLTGQDISYDFITEVGFIYDRIEEHAKKKSVLFLVMDKNMITANQENYEEIVEHIQVPLVIVPTPINAIV
jgi:nucleotide-binding universal stress UspA family protein